MKTLKMYHHKLYGFGILLACLVASVGSAYGQEYVPNGDFETSTSCPWYTTEVGNNQIAFATGWMSANLATPDYFNACNTDICNADPARKRMDVPDNHYGYQFAQDGDAYGGVVVNSQGTWCEYLKIELQNQPIKPGKYNIKYYVNVADGSSFRLKNWGAYITSDPSTVSNTGSLGAMLGLWPGFKESQDLVAVNSLPNDGKDDWVLIEGTVSARGGETYIVIGYMGANVGSDQISISSSTVCEPADAWSYNYIDGVSMTGICTHCDWDIELIPTTTPENCVQNDIHCYVLNILTNESMCPIYGVRLRNPDCVPNPPFMCREGVAFPVHSTPTAPSQIIKWGKVTPVDLSPTPIGPGSSATVGEFCFIGYNRWRVRLEFIVYDENGNEMCRKRVCLDQQGSTYQVTTCDPADLTSNCFQGSKSGETEISPGNQLQSGLSVVPNPVTAQATVTYDLPQASPVKLELYNSLGVRIAVIAEGDRNKGLNTVNFETAGLSSGVYFLKLHHNDRIQSIPVTISR